MLAADHVPQLVVTSHCRHRLLLRVRNDLAGEPRGVLDQAVLDIVRSSATVRYGAPSWKLQATRPCWVAELVTLGTPAGSGPEWMHVAVVLTCRRDYWLATTILTKVRRTRAARLFAPAWQAVAARPA
jgi:hypothetical protein